MTRVLVTGAAGLLGAAITREFSRDSEVIALDHAALDIADEGSVGRTMSSASPHVVINCAAFNDVDGAESDAPRALSVNAVGVLGLSRAAQAAGATFIHYGTDFVFDGEGVAPYREDDPPNPKAVYGCSKLLGDWFALKHPSGYVLRVESLFGDPGPGKSGKGSLAAILSRIDAGEPVSVFVDRTVSPSYTTDIARATRQVVATRPAPGLYHCVNSGAATWAEIAREAARLLQRPWTMLPITLETADLKAPRPRYCALSNEKLHAAGIAMPTWQDALARHVKNAHRPDGH